MSDPLKGLSGSSLRTLLECLYRHELTVDQVLPALERTSVADLGFAHVDLDREKRCGFPEVIFCEGKTPQQVLEIVQRLRQAGQDCLATRVQDDQADLLRQHFPEAEQDRVARTFWLAQPRTRERWAAGRVGIVTAGTADLPVAREALATVRAFGCDAELIVDVGVAGIHRLLRHLERLRQMDVLVVVAGMEGALPSAVGGLVSCPVIAVPTSVGYGASLGGLAALLSMLNSCAANVAVVNIDSGFKGGYVAALIARRSH
ncbi:MAG: nickel pincer cofactor biosynthesis protein LarB [Gemmatales bacterium]|nr:nickel pincer cofactor biosynthesis protein LarB [Gemmatales bacterium]MDW8222977.1 nickel pincer cofactor biosynthesis protein LarB [Gemmatales bacterium]